MERGGGEKIRGSGVAVKLRWPCRNLRNERARRAFGQPQTRMDDLIELSGLLLAEASILVSRISGPKGFSEETTPVGESCKRVVVVGVVVVVVHPRSPCCG
jgi:hypothetical protein